MVESKVILIQIIVVLKMLIVILDMYFGIFLRKLFIQGNNIISMNLFQEFSNIWKIPRRKINQRKVIHRASIMLIRNSKDTLLFMNKNQMDMRIISILNIYKLMKGIKMCMKKIQYQE
jgi:hypothetical protein